VVVVAVMAAVAYASSVEWFVHKVVYHRWFARQHALHHADYAGTQFRQPGKYRSLQPWWFELVILAVHVPAVVLGARYVGATAAIAAFAVVALYAALSNYAHTAIHRPCGRRIERTHWYRLMVERHLAHHLDPDVALSIPLAIADRLWGTMPRGDLPRNALRVEL